MVSYCYIGNNKLYNITEAVVVNECDIGTYYESGQDTCLDCPLGYFNSNTYQTSCVKCPDGMTTLDTAMTSETSCYSK